RIVLGMHFLSDVLAGMVLGVALGCASITAFASIGLVGDSQGLRAGDSLELPSSIAPRLQRMFPASQAHACLRTHKRIPSVPRRQCVSSRRRRAKSVGTWFVPFPVWSQIGDLV